MMYMGEGSEAGILFNRIVHDAYMMYIIVHGVYGQG